MTHDPSSLDDIALSLLNLQGALKKIQADTTCLKETRNTSAKDPSSFNEARYVRRVEEVVTSVIHAKVERKLLEVERTLNGLMPQASSSFLKKMKRGMPWMGGIFMGILLSAVLFYYQPCLFPSYQDQLLTYYGTLLKKAWPHLNEKEKKRVIKLSSFTSLKP
tara:strand:+ start:175 stop:663 length:489 start_codon:yes stop_codon:yes gene_type:complete